MAFSAPTTLSGARAVFVEHVRNDGSALGRALPAHATALGKALLAQLETAQIDALIAELAGIRERGHAIEDEEYDTGLRSIAAPVREQTGHVVAAVGVLGAADRLTNARMSRLADAVTRAAAAFSRRLGAGQDAALTPRRPTVEVSAVVEHTPPLVPGAEAEEVAEEPAKRPRRRPPARGTPGAT